MNLRHILKNVLMLAGIATPLTYVFFDDQDCARLVTLYSALAWLIIKTIYPDNVRMITMRPIIRDEDECAVPPCYCDECVNLREPTPPGLSTPSFVSPTPSSVSSPSYQGTSPSYEAPSF